MKDSQLFDHRPDPELSAALKAALEPKTGQAIFVARVMVGYDDALRRATAPTWEVLASWFRPSVAAAAAALVAGILIGRTVLFSEVGNGAAAVSMDAAIASATLGGRGRGPPARTPRLPNGTRCARVSSGTVRRPIRYGRRSARTLPRSRLACAPRSTRNSRPRNAKSISD